MSNPHRLFMHYGSLFFLSFIFSTCQAAEPVPAQQQTTDINVQRLQDALPVYEAALQHPWPVISPSKKLLRQGAHSYTVLLLRERLIATHDLAPENNSSEVFDKTLTQAVKNFQWRNGLKSDGIVGMDTIRQLDISPQQRIDTMRLNIQRWAQFSQQAGDRYVMVNIPEFKLHLVENGKETLNMKVIVGRPTRQTPELASTITRLEFNPYWNVPQMIADKDIVPKVIDDSSYLRKEQIRIFNNQEDMDEISQNEVNWEDAEENGLPYHLRQEPGSKNALGLVRFEFQNDHNVYLHDTPAKRLFDADIRDFSSGCVRLEKPFSLVSYLIQNDPETDMNKVQALITAQKNKYYRLKDPIPVFITYITSWVDENGVVHFADDVYQRDNPQATQIPQERSNVS